MPQTVLYTENTWVDLLVGGYAVRVHNRLEAASELVDLVVSGRNLLRLHAVEDGGHSGTTSVLQTSTGWSKHSVPA